MHTEIYTNTDIQSHTQTHIYTDIHTYIHTWIYTQIYTYKKKYTHPHRQTVTYILCPYIHRHTLMTKRRVNSQLQEGDFKR